MHSQVQLLVYSMQSFQNALAYLISAVIYQCKPFITMVTEGQTVEQLMDYAYASGYAVSCSYMCIIISHIINFIIGRIWKALD